MEYLMNYGWMLLLVIIVIAALVYTGILNPSRFLPSTIDFGPGIIVPDYTMSFFESDEINIGHFVFILKNGLGKNMVDTVVNIKECEGNTGKNSSPVFIAEGDSAKLTVTCENVVASVGEEEVFNVELYYNTNIKGQLSSHTKSAVMKVSAQRLKEFPDTNSGRKAWALENGASGENNVNRFYPCDDVVGCATQDIDGTLKKVFGGYVDSTSGKVWAVENGPDPIGYTWSEMNGGTWDSIQPYWNEVTKNYEYNVGDGISVSLKDDVLGTAFNYCSGFVSYGYSDWKLPSMDDFDSGMLQCNECIPPLETYPPLGMIKFYWTDTLSVDYGFSKTAQFGQNVGFNMDSNTNRDQKEKVRCIRDNDA